MLRKRHRCVHINQYAMAHIKAANLIAVMCRANARHASDQFSDRVHMARTGVAACPLCTIAMQTETVSSDFIIRLRCRTPCFQRHAGHRSASASNQSNSNFKNSCCSSIRQQSSRHAFLILADELAFLFHCALLDGTCRRLSARVVLRPWSGLLLFLHLR